MREEETALYLKGEKMENLKRKEALTEIVLGEKPKFEFGQMVMTAGIAQKMEKSRWFRAFVRKSLNQYSQCDWGDTCEEDKQSNDYALTHGERLLAVYQCPEPETTIWIITEWDRSVTTILFPNEY